MSSGESKIDQAFPRGVLRPELYIGALSSVSPNSVRFNVTEAGKPSGAHFLGGRYGKGEVGEFVLIEGQINLLLGRVIEIHLPEKERRSVSASSPKNPDLDVIGTIQLLGSVAMDTLGVTAGVDSYPRLGDRVYAAPHNFVADLPSLMEVKSEDGGDVLLKLGSIDVAQESFVSIRPEKLFGRHCAILGATGGGKSWTTARVIEECLRFDSKIFLIDATGEYRELLSEQISHVHLGDPPKKAATSLPQSIPPSVFSESDFVSLFRPSPGIQAPKLREALCSLRMVAKAVELGIEDEISTDGILVKTGRSYSWLNRWRKDPRFSGVVHNPSAPFDVEALIGQLEAECVWENEDSFGRKNDQHWGFCSSLVSRISHITSCPEFKFVFSPEAGIATLSETIETFFGDANTNVLRVCLSGVTQEFQSKEIIANVIGRLLLKKARSGAFSAMPLIVFVDEAHNFLGRKIGLDDSASNLDAFELIAKEGRKFGLCICLATQRPRDVTEGVLSQIGTLIVHRLTNDQDRNVVERACGEIDRAASSFLPNLKPGEAAIIGADFPIPLTIRITPPLAEPKSDGPSFQKHWTSETS